MRNSRGKPTQHHITYELFLDDGRIYRTRVSRPANTDVYGKGLWSHILDDQLHVTENEFWNCVNHATLPNRSTSPTPVTTAIPAALAYQLVNTLKLTQEEIVSLTTEEAAKLMADYWSQPPE